MDLGNRDLYQVWAMRLSIGTMTIVVLLSFLNQIQLFDVIIRAAVSFGVMYILTNGTITLFERTAPRKSQECEIDKDNGRGGNIDFSVGDDELQGSLEQDPQFPGQVDRDLSSGLPDSERQAEIVKRMGWS